MKSEDHFEIRAQAVAVAQPAAAGCRQTLQARPGARCRGGRPPVAGDWHPGPDDLIQSPAVKVALDRLVAGALLALSSPLSLAIVAAELVDGALSAGDRGPVLYSETRVSQGRAFTLHKFRILKTSAIAEIEAGAVPKAVENRPGTLTQVGRVLKKTGLDELPQLVNVLRGDMSLVGPRPKPLAEYEAGIAEGDYRRTVVRAGLTGPAQLLKGTVRTVDDDRAVDLAYLRMLRSGSQLQVLRTDLRLLGSTVRLMLKMTGE